MRRFLLLLVLAPRLFAGDIFQKSHELATLETKHFTLIFARDQQRVAEALAALAEPVFDEVTAQLPVRPDFHIPVVMTPDTDVLNGYFTTYPSMRIVLYQAPISPNSGFAVFNDTLRKLFLHELTHAVSLTQTSAWSTFLAAVFGDAVLPGPAASPPSLTEGVSVALESADGWGRANDAESAGLIQQALLEDRFPTFLEAAGARESWPRGIHYVYGGWFSRYLRERDGEAFVRLWKRMGAGDSPLDDWPFTGVLQEEFHQPVEALWADFGRWMALKIPVAADIDVADARLTEVLAVAGTSDRLYWADRTGLWMRVGDTSERLAVLNGLTNRLAVSADGTKVLISTARASGALARATLREYDVARRQFTNRPFPEGLMEAAYDGEGLVALRVRGYTVDLVAVDAGEERLLLHGTESLTPSQPLRVDGALTFLLDRAGQRNLARLNQDGSVSVLESPLKGIRQISTDGHTVWFVWDNDLTLLKLGAWNGSSLVTYPTTLGGAGFPQPVGPSVYYFGSFGQGQKLLRLKPATGEVHRASWKPLPPVDEGRYDQPARLSAAAYNPLPALLAPQLRLPWALWDLGGYPRLLRAAGVLTSSTDPAGLVSLDTHLGWRWYDGSADWSADGTWHGPFEMSVGAFDELATGNPYDTTALRQRGVRGALSGELAADVGRFPWAFSASLLRADWSTAYGLEGKGVEAAPLSVAAGYQGVAKTFLGQRDGWNWTGTWDGDARSSGSTAQLEADWYVPFANLRTAVTGLAALGGAVLTPSGPRQGDRPWMPPVSFDYPATFEGWNLESSWLVQARLSAGAVLPINAEWGGTYYNSVDVEAGYKTLWMGQRLDTVFASLGMHVHGGAPGTLGVPLGFGATFEKGLSSEADWTLRLWAGDPLL